MSLSDRSMCRTAASLPMIAGTSPVSFIFFRVRKSTSPHTIFTPFQSFGGLDSGHAFVSDGKWVRSALRTSKSFGWQPMSTRSSMITFAPSHFNRSNDSGKVLSCLLSERSNSSMDSSCPSSAGSVLILFCARLRNSRDLRFPHSFGSVVSLLPCRLRHFRFSASFPIEAGSTVRSFQLASSSSSWVRLPMVSGSDASLFS